MSDHDFAVLIVDDEESQAKGLAEWLRRTEEVEVEVATSGGSALDLLRQTPHRYGVVLLDQIFPSGWTGIETLRHIKTEFPDVFVVVLTHDTEEGGFEALRQGAYRSIIKPINNQEVRVLIRHVGEIRAMERRLRLERQLLKISQLALSGDYNELADYITEAIKDLTGTDVSLWMIRETPEGPMLYIKAGQGLLGDYQEKAKLSLDPKRSVVATCLKDKLPRVKRDIFNDKELPPFHFKDQAKLQGWKSFLAVPLLNSTGSPLGALSIYSRVMRDFREAEKDLLKTFANQAAVALENVQLTQQAKTRQASLEQLERIGQITLEKITDETAVLEQYVKSACELTGAPCAVIYPYDPERDEFYDEDRVVAFGLIDEKKKVSERPRKRGLARIVRKTGTIAVNDIKAGDIAEVDLSQVEDNTGKPLTKARLLEFVRKAKFVRRERIKAFIAVPLRVAVDSKDSQQLAEVGVLYINYRVPHKFTDHELSLTQLFAQQVAGLIRAARLRSGQQEQLRVRSILAEASNAIAKATEYDDILKAVFWQSFKLTGKATGLVMAIEADRRLRIVDSLGVPKERLEAFHSRPTYAHEGSFGIVTRTGRVFECRDTAKALNSGQMIDASLPIPAQVTNIPLKSEGRVVGILVLDTVAPDRQVRDALLSLAEVAGIALERARRARTLTELNELGKALTRAPDLRAVLEGAVERAEALLGAEAVVLYLYDRQSDSIVIPPTHRGVQYPEVLQESGAFHDNSVPRRLIHSGKSSYASDAASDSAMAGSARAADDVPTFVQREGIASSAGVLLKAMGQIVGVLFVNYRTRHDFGKAEREAIQLFASQVAVAIQNALRLEQERELRKQADMLRRQADALKNISEGLNSSFTPAGVAKKVLDGLKQVIDYRKATFQLIPDRDKPRTIICYRGFGKEAIDSLHLRPVSQDPLIGTIVASDKPLILSRTRDNCSLWEANHTTDDIESWVGIPIKWAGKVRALITLDHGQAGYYTDTMENLLLSVAGQAAVAIERAEAVQALLRRIEIVEEVAQVISSELDIDNLMQTIVTQVAKTLRCTHCTLFLAETRDGEGWLVPRKTYGGRPEVLNRQFRTNEGLAGLVYQTGRSVVCPDVRNDPHFAKAREGQDRPRSMLVVPIKVGDQTIGVISADQDEFGWFSEGDRRLLDALAQQIGTAIQRSAGLKLQREVGNRIVSSQDESAVLQAVISGACELINTSAGAIYLLSEDSQAAIKDFHYPPEFNPPPPRLNSGLGLTAEIIRTRQLVAIPDFDQYPDIHKDLRALGFRSLVGVPMQLAGMVTAVLYLYDRDIHQFNEVEESLLSVLADQGAIAIKNARLYTELSRRAKQLEILPTIYERIIVVGIENADQLFALLYDIACEVMDLSNAQVQFASYEADKNEVTFPLAVEKDKGEKIDEIRWGKRDAKYRKAAEDELVEAFMPRQRGSRFGLTEYVIQTKQIVFIAENFWKTASALRVEDQKVRVLPTFGRLERSTHSWLGVPMVVQGQVIGVISIQSLKQERAFTQEQVDLLTSVANQAAVAIENARLYERLGKQVVELEAAQAKIAEAEAALVRMSIAGDFVHRMNNLAGTIPVWASLIAEELEPTDSRDDRIAHYLNEIKRDVYELLQAAERLRMPPHAEDIQITNLLRSMLHDVAMLHSSTIRTVAIFEPGVYRVRAISALLADALWNLFSNALEAMPQGGTLSVSVSRVIDEEAKWAKIEIQDTGQGIPKSDLPSLFSLFFTTKGEGRGYGLWRTNNVIRDLGGRIEARSQQDMGSTFIVLLPECPNDEMSS